LVKGGEGAGKRRGIVICVKSRGVKDKVNATTS